MEFWCQSKHKSSLFILMMLLRFMVCHIEEGYIEDEKKALLGIKASLQELSFFLDVDNLLPTWVDHGDAGGEYCDWERIQCDPSSVFVTELSLGNLFSMEEYEMNGPVRMVWPLNFSLFLHFRELRSLDLSMNHIGNTFLNTGLRRLSGLKKLEILNLNTNNIETNIIPLLSELTSLKVLDLGYVNGYQGDSPTHDISEFPALENLEVLDLNSCGYYGILQIQGSKNVSTLRKLKVINFRNNQFNESLVTSLSALPSLTSLDLHGNFFSGSFPSQELSHFTNLENLDLSLNNLSVTSSIQACKSLIRLERLESISLGTNYFNKSIISCLSFLPSLKTLDLSRSVELRHSFPLQELSSMRVLQTLDMSYCSLDSLKLNGSMRNLLHLNLDMNYFNDDDIMRSMAAFPSLRFLSLDGSFIKGRTLFANDFPNFPFLEVLILSYNDFNGALPIEALTSFHHLEVLDLSKNNFSGSIPSTINSLSSIKAISFAYNNLNGLSDDAMCELKSLLELDLRHNQFDGNLPECFMSLSSLKLFDISSNQFKGNLPYGLTNLTSLEYIDFSHNQFEGSFSFSSFSNHRKLEVVAFVSDNNKFEVETEEPIGWAPMFQLGVLVLSNCNINKPKGSMVPSFLLHQHKLRKVDMSRNSLKGNFPSWLINNNSMLEVLILRDNSFGGTFCMPFNRNPNTWWLDLSRNHMTGAIPTNIMKSLPYITHLNISMNFLDGAIPSSISDLGELQILDLSHNKFFGEVPPGIFSNLSKLFILKLSNNSLHGEVLSRELNMEKIRRLQLDSNNFTGKIGDRANNTSALSNLRLLDISNNFFTGLIPDWISNSTLFEFVARNNTFGGPFPCGPTPFSFLDISKNYLSGPIPSCLYLQDLKHLHLSSNRFTGTIPDSFRGLINVLTLDIGDNNLSGVIPEFLGELSTLRILLLNKNKFRGSIPKQLCQLTGASLIDLSSNFLSDSIPECLQYITGPSYQAFRRTSQLWFSRTSFYYKSILNRQFTTQDEFHMFEIQDEVLFTTKTLSLTYKGDVLDIMSGLDLSCNKLSGDIPEVLGLLTQIHVLNLSHNMLSGPIPAKFSNLANIESLDLSYNNLTGKVPSELVKLNSLAAFDVSFNNLSGRLPEMTAQFSTFSKDSYEGNPFLCGPPLENKCMVETHGTRPLNKQGNDDEWYDIDMASFYGCFGSTWFVFILGFLAVLYINPYWRRTWLNLIEESMYTCYYFLNDLVTKVCTLFRK